jgi:hypothetical protein
MLSMRTVTVLTIAVSALDALSACSGSDSSGDKKPSANTSSATDKITPSDTPTKTPVKTKDCTANVQLSGAIKASWSGEATTSTGGYEKNASYTTSKAGVTVAVLSAAKMRATPIVAKGGVTYTAQPKSGVVKVDKKGGGGEVDAKATVLKDGKIKTVNVKATFDC